LAFDSSSQVVPEANTQKRCDKSFLALSESRMGHVVDKFQKLQGTSFCLPILL
jgi:hypothetical protein